MSALPAQTTSTSLRRIAALFDQLSAEDRAYALLEISMILKVSSNDALNRFQFLRCGVLEQLDNPIPRNVF